MKTLFRTRLAVFGLLVTGWIGASAQSVIESEVPGDNFSLEGALELFKDSSSPEEFERKLNSADSKVNNLDLNNDGYIDYMRVINRTDRNVHLFIIQAVLSKKESQDVAVIELEKLANGRAVLQITGDADVYGMETIIEPTEEVYVNAGTTRARRVVNVWTWPSVQYVYSPYYVVYESPWYWSYHPFWYRPWRPVAYYVYDPWWRPYRSYYSVCHTHRVGYAWDMYRPYRTTSIIVHNHYGTQINNYRSRNDHGTRGRDRYADHDNRNNNGSRSDGRREDNSTEASRLAQRNSESIDRSAYSVENIDARSTGFNKTATSPVRSVSEYRSGNRSSSISERRTDERVKAFEQTRTTQADRSVNEYRRSAGSNSIQERGSEARFENKAVREYNNSQQTRMGTQKNFERSSDFNRSTERLTDKSRFENVRSNQSDSYRQSNSPSRTSVRPQQTNERPSFSKPSGASNSSGSGIQKTRPSRGKN